MLIVLLLLLAAMAADVVVVVVSGVIIELFVSRRWNYDGVVFVSIVVVVVYGC